MSANDLFVVLRISLPMPFVMRIFVTLVPIWETAGSLCQYVSCMAHEVIGRKAFQSGEG